MAEGFCDVMGQFAEFNTNSNFSTSTSNIDDFVHGGNNPSGIIPNKTRSLANPLTTGNPTARFGTNFVEIQVGQDQSDVDAIKYKNATLIGRFYFLLSQGGNGNTGFPTNADFCVTGIGQTKAAKIMFLASTIFINNTNRTWQALFGASVNAVRSLMGSNFTFEEGQVVAALRGIGISDPLYVNQISLFNHSATGVENHEFNSPISSGNFTVTSTSTTKMTSAEEVGLLTEFNVENGGVYNGFITPQCSGAARLYNPNNSTPDNASEAVAPLDNALPLSFNCKVYPNPFSSAFTISCEHDHFATRATLYNSLGVKILEEKNLSLQTKQFQVPADLPPGLYLVEIVFENVKYCTYVVKN